MIVVVMGVTGCGKTTVGRALAEALQCRFHDADEYHPPANREKMGRGIPLDDADRLPWLRTLAELLAREGADGRSLVLACSALKEPYREILRSCGHPLTFVHLRGSQERIADRLRRRAGCHEIIRDFDRILEGQFRDLEPPSAAINVDIEQSAEAVAAEVVQSLGLTRKAPTASPPA